MHIYYSYKAAAQLASLDTPIQKRIVLKMRFFAHQPDPIRFAKYIDVKNAFRFRVGDYRIYFEIRNDILTVRTIERRDKAYD